jgi:hypothetical protein
VPCTSRTPKQVDFSAPAPAAAGGPRQTGPLGEGLTDAELEPIRVYAEAGAWRVDYGSYASGHHSSREAAIEQALKGAVWENRELTIERPRKISETVQTGLSHRRAS